LTPELIIFFLYEFTKVELNINYLLEPGMECYMVQRCSGLEIFRVLLVLGATSPCCTKKLGTYRPTKGPHFTTGYYAK
jgi:hypothetical protein